MPESHEKVQQPATAESAAETAFEASLVELEGLLGETMPPILVQSRAAFRRDLPLLLATHPGKWVCYHGDQRVGIGPTKTHLYQEGLRRGLTRGQFLVLRVEPERSEETEIPLDM